MNYSDYNTQCPDILMIEPTNVCDLKCPLCLTGSGISNVPKGFMSWEIFTKVIDGLLPFIKTVKLWGGGEPFLHPLIFEMIEYLSKKNIKSVISTNGTCFSSPDFINKIIRSKLNTLIISLDGATKETYLKYRSGGDFDAIMNTIIELNKLQANRDIKLPRIKLQFIVMKHNEHEIELIKEIAKKYQLILKLKPLSDQILKDEFLPTKEEYSRLKKENDMIMPRFEQPSKCLAWSTITVNWDGSMVSCCKDGLRENYIGTIDETNNVLDLWNSKTFESLREDILIKKETISKCKNCIWYFE